MLDSGRAVIDYAPLLCSFTHNMKTIPQLVTKQAAQRALGIDCFNPRPDVDHCAITVALGAIQSLISLPHHGNNGAGLCGVGGGHD